MRMRAGVARISLRDESQNECERREIEDSAPSTRRAPDARRDWPTYRNKVSFGRRNASERLTESKDNRSRRERQLDKLPSKRLGLRTHSSAMRGERVDSRAEGDFLGCCCGGVAVERGRERVGGALTRVLQSVKLAVDQA